MPAALIAALVCTVVLLVITAYFLMGSVPLLILRHDTPLDAQFVGGFFGIYYRAAGWAALATAVGYALAGLWALAWGAVLLALLAWALRRSVVPRMADLRARIQAGQAGAVQAFRRLHTTVILLNLAQLVAIVWSLIALSMGMR